MAVPKIRTFLSKKHIRKNVWKKSILAGGKSILLAKSNSTGKSKKNFARQTSNKVLE